MIRLSLLVRLELPDHVYDKKPDLDRWVTESFLDFCARFGELEGSYPARGQVTQVTILNEQGGPCIAPGLPPDGPICNFGFDHRAALGQSLDPLLTEETMDIEFIKWWDRNNPCYSDGQRDAFQYGYDLARRSARRWAHRWALFPVNAVPECPPQPAPGPPSPVAILACKKCGATTDVHHVCEVPSASPDQCKLERRCYKPDGHRPPCEPWGGGSFSDPKSARGWLNRIPTLGALTPLHLVVCAALLVLIGWLLGKPLKP